MIIQEILSILRHVLLWAVIPFGWWLVRRKEPFLQSVGLYWPEAAWKGCFAWTGVFFGISLISQLYITPAILPEGIAKAQQYSGMGMAAMLPAISFGISTGLGEEIFWRGFMARRLAKRWGVVKGNMVQALAFGLLHGLGFAGMLWMLSSQADMSFSESTLLTVFLGSTILAGLGGWILGRVTLVEAQGSIVPAVLIHGFGNFLLTMAEAYSFF